VPAGGADFGGEVGKGQNIVAHAHAGVAELAADRLNAVAGVTGEVDDYLGESVGGF